MIWKQCSAGALVASLYATQALAQDPEVFTKASNESLLWGPYKSNLYFGVRPRIPKSVTASLAWVRVEDFSKVQNNVRHTCEQHEGMDGYGWDSYDPRTGGVQTIHDKGNGIDLETSFVTISEGGWAARVKGTPREDAERMAGTQDSIDTIKTAVWFNLGLEGLGMSLGTKETSSSKDRPTTLASSQSPSPSLRATRTLSPSTRLARRSHWTAPWCTLFRFLMMLSGRSNVSIIQAINFPIHSS
jgi:hypothetical protein